MLSLSCSLKPQTTDTTKLNFIEMAFLRFHFSHFFLLLRRRRRRRRGSPPSSLDATTFGSCTFALLGSSLFSFLGSRSCNTILLLAVARKPVVVVPLIIPSVGQG